MSLERVIISGGGTGGHIYPAISIADEMKRQFPDVKILFIGAKGRMEMEKIPEYGYEIQGLTIAGFNRKNILKNFGLPFKILNSLIQARRIIKEFNPQLLVGVGGYASGPSLKMANWMGIKTILQEQNSYPGKTNLLLAKKASAICVAYPKMEAFFPNEKVFITGNPVRSDINNLAGKRDLAMAKYYLDPSKKIILVIGGSLGSKTLNDTIIESFGEIQYTDSIQIIWQCGKAYFDEINEMVLPENVRFMKFIDTMDLAYAAADCIVSRAGATSISELTIVGKPVILVPSPNVSEDHQTKNAMALVERKAALLIKDSEAKDVLLKKLKSVLFNVRECEELSANIKKLALPNACKDIVTICNKTVES